MTSALTAAVATRFPLVARKRPPAKPLDNRIARLVQLAEIAHRDHDSDTASMAFNGAALLASDCGDPKLARTWCHRHANLYLSQAPLNGYTARFALEPIVNLARLRIRASDPDGAYAMLTTLHRAIRQHIPTAIDGLELHPEYLPVDPQQRRQITEWLHNIMVTDGTRALTLSGRWNDVLHHIHHYDGIGPTLHEGRQAAVIAHTMQDQGCIAYQVLQDAVIDSPWAQAVLALLQTWLDRTAGIDERTNSADLLERSLTVPSSPGLSLFRTRLILAAVDLATNIPAIDTDDIIAHLVNNALEEQDANAARELHRHSSVDSRHHASLHRLIQASGLDAGYLPDTETQILASALDLAETVIAP